MKRTFFLKKWLSTGIALILALSVSAGAVYPAAAEADKEIWDRANRELSAAYDMGYREMYEKWTPEALMEKYMDNMSDESRERFNQTAGMVNDLYDRVNSANKWVKYIIPAAVAWEDGALSGIGAGLFLSDSSLGSGLRESAGYLLALGEALADAYWNSKVSRMNSADLVPVKSENGFTLLRTFGTVNGIIKEIGGRTVADAAVNVLDKELQRNIPTDQVKAEYLMGKFDPTDPFELETAIQGQRIAGKARAITHRIREWENVSLTSVYMGTSTFTINGEPVLSADGINQALDALEGTVTFSPEDLERIRTEGPVTLERLILKNGIGLTEQEIDELRDDKKPSVRVSAVDYIKSLKSRADAAGEDSSRYDPMINALQATRENASIRMTYPAAENDYIYFLMDQDYHVVNQFLCPVSGSAITIGKDGAIALGNAKSNLKGSWPDYEDENRVILDPAGRVLYQNQISKQKDKLDSVIWYDLTPSGNILRKTYTSSVQYGDHELLELVRPDGTVTEVLRGNKIQRITDGDYYTDEIPFSFIPTDSSEYGINDVVVDVRTGEVRKGKKDAPQEPAEEIYQDPRAGLSDEFLLTGERLVRREDGKPICDFSTTGGIKKIQQIGDQFWILSNTGYFYVMDMDLRIQSDDYIRLDPESSYRLNEYGLLEETSRNEKNSWKPETRKLGADGSVLAEYPNMGLGDIQNFWIGNEKYGYYDLQTGQKMHLGVISGNYNRTVVFPELEQDEEYYDRYVEEHPDWLYDSEWLDEHMEWIENHPDWYEEKVNGL